MNSLPSTKDLGTITAPDFTLCSNMTHCNDLKFIARSKHGHEPHDLVENEELFVTAIVINNGTHTLYLNGLNELLSRTALCKASRFGAHAT